jgi:hypothetical protein
MSERTEKKSLPAIPVDVWDQVLAGGDIKGAFASYCGYGVGCLMR